MDLRELQAQQPWVIPYSREFEESTARNTLRQVEHDIMHVLKGLGRVAAECERRDHDSRHVYDEGLIADNTADLVICALHIASTVGFDLEDVVIGNKERRNGVKLRAEP
jgi:antirestriction protein ArdC